MHSRWLIRAACHHALIAPAGVAYSQRCILRKKYHEVSSTPRKTGPHIKCIQRRLKHWVPGDGQVHCSTKFAFDPDGFICDPSEIVVRIFDQAFGSGDIQAGEVDPDGGQAWRGGGFNC